MYAYFMHCLYTSANTKPRTIYSRNFQNLNLNVEFPIFTLTFYPDLVLKIYNLRLGNLFPKDYFSGVY